MYVLHTYFTVVAHCTVRHEIDCHKRQPLTYTVGLCPRHPELVVVGLDLDTGLDLMHAALDRVARGERWMWGEIETIGSHQIAMAEATAALCSAMVQACLHHPARFGALHLTYKSGDGRWPWESDAPCAQSRFGRPMFPRA